VSVSLAAASAALNFWDIISPLSLYDLGTVIYSFFIYRKLY
jgi:hypothetical protein